MGKKRTINAEKTKSDEFGREGPYMDLHGQIEKYIGQYN
jgi:hypothetical protein